MKLKRGIELLEQREGVGETASNGDRVLYNLKMFWNQGDKGPLHLAFREEGLLGLVPANAVLVVELWLREV